MENNWRNKKIRYYTRKYPINFINKTFIKLFSGFIFDKSTRESIRASLLASGFVETFKRIKEIKKLSKKDTHFKYYLSVILTIKDEAQYLKEWIEFYLLQGVDHFYIYDNESSDNIKYILTPYIDKGLVTYEIFEGVDMQYNIYNKALEDNKFESKWLVPLDTDEFAYAPNYNTLKDYLKDNEQYNQIYMDWYIYGNSGHETKPEGLVIENYVMREKVPSGPTKAFVQGTKTIIMLVHKHSVIGRTKFTTPDEIRCNHYYGKSVEEFKAKKVKRGAIDGAILDMSLYNRHNKNEIEDSMPKEIIEQVKKRLNN